MTRITIGSAAAGLALAGVSVLGTATAATAAPDPASCAYAQNCPVAATDYTPVPGQAVTMTAGPGSFTPGSPVRFTVFGVTRTITAGSDGAASDSFTVPTDQAPGSYTAVFEGQQPVPGTTGASSSSSLRAGGFTAAYASTRPGAGYAVSAVRSAAVLAATRPNRVVIQFTVVRAAGGSDGGSAGTTGGASGGSLPRTGSSELVPIGIGGLTLVAAGASVLLVARRRREHDTAGA